MLRLWDEYRVRTNGLVGRKEFRDRCFGRVRHGRLGNKNGHNGAVDGSKDGRNRLAERQPPGVGPAPTGDDDDVDIEFIGRCRDLPGGIVGVLDDGTEVGNGRRGQGGGLLEYVSSLTIAGLRSPSTDSTTLTGSADTCRKLSLVPIRLLMYPATS